MDKRCVVCHSCYNSPCQLKLSSFEGVDRGATKEAVYNGARLKTMDPTRLFTDAQYTPEELSPKKRLGHSSWEQAIEVAEMAGVKKLALSHHDPDHNDDFLESMERECQARFPGCFLTREGVEIEI